MRTGFPAWKHALTRFAKHETTHTHQEAVTKLQSVATVNIAGVLNSRLKEKQLQRQQMLLKHLSALRYLVRQGLAIRGHEENEGNLIQLLHMWSAHDVDMKAWLKEGNYLSRDIINEQIKMMADQVLRNLLLEIRGARIFSILADKATDIACKEQMSVTICWVSDEYNIFEDPIGLVHLSKMDAATIFEALKDVLQRCILPVSQCRGQGYDGASCMSGRISGVASRFKVEEPVALYVHCLAHCLNLYRQDASRVCISIRDSLDLVIELVKLIKFYPKRTTLFEQIKANLSPETNSLKVAGMVITIHIIHIPRLCAYTARTGQYYVAFRHFLHNCC